MFEECDSQCGTLVIPNPVAQFANGGEGSTFLEVVGRR